MNLPYLVYLARRRLMRLPLIWPLAKAIPVTVDLRGMLLQRLPKNAHCVEIGVWKGAFSTRILEVTKPRLLHLVDPWMYQADFPDRLYGGKDACQQQDMDGIYNQVLDTFGKLPNVEIHRQSSKDFLSPAVGPFDWVYIDGDHSMSAVTEDLELSWRHVREKGIIAGDDYYWKDSDGSRSVKKAVDSFCKSKGRQPELIGGQFLIRR